MNRKQLNAFLKVMSKDTSRPILCTAYVDKIGDKFALVATDGYKLTAFYIDDEAEQLVGRMVKRSSLERWYKLADGKARLNGFELDNISQEEYTREGWQEGNYPKWQSLIPTGEQVPQPVMSFNADFVKTIQDLNGTEEVTIELYGKLAPMIIRNEQSLSLVMPMKGK